MNQEPTSSHLPVVFLFDLSTDEGQILTLLERLAEENADIDAVKGVCNEAHERAKSLLKAACGQQMMLICFVWDRKNDAWLPVVCDPFTQQDTDSITKYTSSIASLFQTYGVNQFEFKTTGNELSLIALCVQALLELFTLRNSVGMK